MLQSKDWKFRLLRRCRQLLRTKNQWQLGRQCCSSFFFCGDLSYYVLLTHTTQPLGQWRPLVIFFYLAYIRFFKGTQLSERFVFWMIGGKKKTNCEDVLKFAANVKDICWIWCTLQHFTCMSWQNQPPPLRKPIFVVRWGFQISGTLFPRWVLWSAGRL